MRKIITLVFFIVIGLQAYCQLKIACPLKGVQGKDYFINYYVDHDTKSGSIRDAFCGIKTYDGHKGTDFLLKNFRVMDSGIYVYAIADGRVYEVEDGNFDRNKTLNNGAKSNYIGIGCKGNYYFRYYHLMKNSMLVKVGDTVSCGQPIAKIGASGYASVPHLHLEITNKLNSIIDPFRAPCKTDTSVLWLDQPAYDTSLYTIDNGFVPYVPGYDTLREKYLVTDSFCIKKDTVVCFWSQMHGLRKDDELKYMGDAEWSGMGRFHF